jgi:ABC-type bacteriocin/lantibiotic exporter with double-glycine peptidase domain
MVQLWNSIVLTNAYLERIRDITDSEVEKNINSGEIKELKGDIKLKNVSFAYTVNSKEVIKNISMHIKPGQKIGIVGPSGSGKSTLSKILLGIYTPTKGKIYFDDLELDKYYKKSLRKQIGAVPQEISLFNKSILDNIRVSNKNISLDKVKKVAKIAQIYDEIEKMPMKYNTFISNMGMNLSGGQRQRIALARAILNNPKILVLDEATSSLDSINESNVSNYFKNIGCTRIVIAHRLSTIIDSDIIFAINNGEIVEFGTHKELMSKKGFYFNLYSC